MNILYISSNNFIPHVMTSIISLCENNIKNNDLYIYVYCENLSNEDKKDLRKIADHYSCKIEYELELQKISKLKELIIQNHFPEFNGCNYTYAKIFPNILYPNLGKLLVIDADTLVLNDIKQLYNTNINNYFAAAVPELLANYVSSEDKSIINRKNFYYNTGVLLFNIKKMNECHYNEKLINALKHYNGILRLADQSLFNLGLNDTDILPISFKYNYNNNCNICKNLRNTLHKDYKDVNLLNIKKSNSYYKDFIILHFVGNLKPWNKYSLVPYSKLYKQYQQKLINLINITKSNKKLFLKFDLKEIYLAYKAFFEYKSFFDKKFTKNKRNFSIISITKSSDNKHHVLTVLGLKFKFKRKSNDKQSKSEHNSANMLAKILSEETLRYLAVQKLHNETFKVFKFKHFNKNISIIGCGPSVKYYNNSLKSINIALNRALFLENLEFTYMFVWDYLGFLEKTPTFFEDVKKYKKCIKFYGKFLNPKIPSIPEYPDDEINNIKHFYSCKRWGLLAQDSNIEIYPDIENYPMADFMSISFPAIQFALYTHPRKLYLIGLDTVQAPNCSNIDNPYNIEAMKKGYVEFKNFAKLHHPDTEIISVNPVGLKGMFRDVYTQSYVDEHPELLNENIEILKDEELVSK